MIKVRNSGINIVWGTSHTTTKIFIYLLKLWNKYSAENRQLVRYSRICWNCEEIRLSINNNVKIQWRDEEICLSINNNVEDLELCIERNGILTLLLKRYTYLLALPWRDNSKNAKIFIYMLQLYSETKIFSAENTKLQRYSQICCNEIVKETFLGLKTQDTNIFNYFMRL